MRLRSLCLKLTIDNHRSMIINEECLGYIVVKIPKGKVYQYYNNLLLSDYNYYEKLLSLRYLFCCCSVDNL